MGGTDSTPNGCPAAGAPTHLARVICDSLCDLDECPFGLFAVGPPGSRWAAALEELCASIQEEKGED